MSEKEDLPNKGDSLKYVLKHFLFYLNVKTIVKVVFISQIIIIHIFFFFINISVSFLFRVL